MWKARSLTAAVAWLALGGAATGAAALPLDVGDRIESRRDRDPVREARVALPRTAAGAIDVPKLIAELRAAITRGARDIRFQDAALSPSEAGALRELAARFGFEGVRIRDDGRRVRVDFSDEARADPRRTGPPRIERDGGRGDPRAERMVNAPRPERAEKVERAERPDRGQRREHVERTERPERSSRSGRH
jgi:hypothetical protein